MLTSSAENMDVSLGQFGGIDDEVFALSPRDHLSDIQKGSLKSVAGGIARCFSGLKLEFRLLMPVELVTRCVMNAAIWYTEGTDVGEYISAIAKTELAQISEDLTALRSKELKTAGDSLTTLLRTAPLLLEMEAGSRRDAALARFADDAEQCQHDADIAFRAVGTMDEQIRAVVIASTAIEATAADGERNFGIVRVELGGQLEKLFELAIVRRDVKNQLNEDPDRRFLDFPGERVRRLNEVVGLLVHVEAWAASHALEPMMPDFVKQPFSIKNLVATGLFRGGRTAAELEKQTTDDGGPAFSPKELQILGGFCSEKIALPPTAAPNKSWWGITSESTADPAPEAVAVEAIAVVPTAEVVREPNPAPSRSWWDFSGSAEEQAERTAREKAEEKIAELEAENAAKIAELEAENAAKEAQRAVREAQARREAEAKIAELEAENAAKEVQRALREARARREAENAAKEAQRAVREAQARREAEAKIAELEAENAAKEVQRALRGARARREAEKGGGGGGGEAAEAEWGPSTIEAHAQIHGGATVHRGATIRSHAQIHGGATIHAGATIGQHAQIHGGATVHTRATVHEHVKVHGRATVGAGATVHAHAQVHGGATVRAGATVPAHVNVPGGSTFG